MKKKVDDTCTGRSLDLARSSDDLDLDACD